jgi:hypothetical protein
MMIKFKQHPVLILGLLAILVVFLGLSPTVASASLPLGITLTPTGEVTSTPESPTDTPGPPTATPGSPTATATVVVVPPNPTPTPTSGLTTPPAPTEEPPESNEPTPTRQPAVLPETGEEFPADPLSTGLSWVGLLTILLFALVGMLVFRAFAGSRAGK